MIHIPASRITYSYRLANVEYKTLLYPIYWLLKLYDNISTELSPSNTIGYNSQLLYFKIYWTNHDDTI